MRYSVYLKEASGQEISIADTFNESIHRKCKPYLKIIKGHDPLYRGMGGINSLGFKNVRKDRRPKAMPKPTAEYLNKWLGKSGHARRDRSVFLTTKTDNLKMHGASYYIFPIGDIKYTWMDAEDINWPDNSTGWYSRAASTWAMSKGKESHVRLTKPFPDYFHTNKDIKTAYKNGYEVWIECDKYYYALMNHYVWDTIKQVIE